jgi:hypothetical protein
MSSFHRILGVDWWTGQATLSKDESRENELNIEPVDFMR